VTGVFFGNEFLTVTRAEDGLDWPQLKAPILAAVMDHFTSGEPLFAGEGGVEQGHGGEVYEGETAQIVAEIKDLLDTRIRPAVAQDGGDILFDRFEPDTGIVWLHMRGACSGCPSSGATLKSGVENMLRHYVPEVTRVEQTL
jgi:Fe-S cluster biogenesis protein NfuA